MRPSTYGLDPAAHASLSALRARVALLDSGGGVVWTNPAWSRLRQRQAGESLAASAVGVNYIALCRRSSHSAANVMAEGIRVVLEGVSHYFEVDVALSGPPSRRTQVAVTPAERLPGGAVVVQTDVYSTSVGLSAQPSVDQEEEPPLGPAIDLTPRERQVLTLMSRGHGNPEIATELGLQYNTVRAHVRSLMAKLEARSRLEAVIRATEAGLVHLPGPETTPGRGEAGG